MVKNRVQKKDKKVPSPSSKTAQDFRPRSSRPNQRILSSIFRKKRKISVFGVNGTSFLQDIQRKKAKTCGKKEKKNSKKKCKKNVRKKSALPSSDSSTFYHS